MNNDVTITPSTVVAGKKASVQQPLCAKLIPSSSKASGVVSTKRHLSVCLKGCQLSQTWFLVEQNSLE